ncbi:MAG: sulfotransferase, partial [Gammaproteobacteria bacterium]|nr:sulfotransferase [Gammaproteobacteria bacterium]
TYHRAEHLQVRIDSQIEVCTAELFARRSGLGHPAPDPVFVVGLPRAGSTLLEQILSSHSQVDGTMELHHILNLAKRLRGRDEPGGKPRYPAILGDLADDYFRRFGEQFIDDTRAYRGDAPYFVDKMPNNFFHVGLIRLILPNAKVIDARRHPMACCFSGYKQLFGEGQEFSYGLTEIGNYYRQYVKLMDHWDRVLPGFVLCVQHEDVVDDLEGQVRRILEFCGLPFEQACVDYHQTERSIRTPSSEQVRQPIFRTSLEQWRNYEPWLGPLKDALGPEIRKRYEVR